MATHYLEFERPIAELETKIEELSKLSEAAGGGALDDEIEALRARAQELREEAYSDLDAWQIAVRPRADTPPVGAGPVELVVPAPVLRRALPAPHA